MSPQWRGSILAAEHGAWNRTLRAQGGCEDVMTGFVADPAHVWGRPVGVAVAHGGAVLVSDDASGVIWRLAR